MNPQGPGFAPVGPHSSAPRPRGTGSSVAELGDSEEGGGEGRTGTVAATCHQMRDACEITTDRPEKVRASLGSRMDEAVGLSDVPALAVWMVGWP